MRFLDSQPGAALSGPEKVAVLLLAVGEQRAAQICSLLERREMLAVSRQVLSLGRVQPEVVDGLLTEFRDKLMEPVGVVGGMAATQKLLASALGSDQASTFLAEVRARDSEVVWGELATVDDDVLAAYLMKEHPQTAAVILARLGADQAARVIARFEDEQATDVLLRLLRMDAVRDDVLADVEQVLQEELAGSLSVGASGDLYGAVAAIFNHLDRSSETRLMQSLEDANKEAADRVRALMFTFEDLGRVDASGVQVLIRAAGNDRLARALKGASEPLRALFFANMSERGGKMLRDEMQGMGPVRLKDVEEAQQFMVNMAKELAAAGQITFTQTQDEEMID